MPEYHFQTELEEVHFPSNREFIAKFKKVTEYGDYSEAIKAAYQQVPDRVTFPAHWYTVFIEQACIRLLVEWNLTENDNVTPLAITVENLRRLRKGDGDYLVGEAGKRMEARPEEDEVPFANGSGGRSAATTRAIRPKS